MLREDTEKLLAGELQRLRAGGREGSSEIRSGNPADEIIKLAKELQADLIMVGSHGQGGLGDFLLGHVSDRLLQYAPCSVLIARTASDQSAVSRQQKRQQYPGMYCWRTIARPRRNRPLPCVQRCRSTAMQSSQLSA